MTKENKIDLGSVQVHNKVFAELITSAMEKVDGVQLVQKNIGNKFLEMFGQKDFPGISIKVGEDREVTLELKVLVRYGLNIPDAAHHVQEAVKSAIDEALDVTVKDININVQGITRGTK